MLNNDTGPARVGSRRIRVPEGTDLVDAVRFAMSSGKAELSEAAALVGVSRRLYAFVRKLLLIKSRQVLTAGEEELVDRAFQVLREAREGSYKEAHELSREVLDRHWVVGTRNGEPRADKVLRARAKLRKRLENTLFAIREACSNDEMEVPASLTASERREFSEQLIGSMSSLWHLFNKIRGGE